MQWRATGIYGYPQHQNKHLTCELINNLHQSPNNKNWLLFGDLNLITRENEKYGGNPIDTNITNLFRATLNLCDLQDLGHKGDIYTWTNRQQNHHLIKARLDRFLANSEWKTMFPNFCNTHLLRYKSDHAPILLDFNTVAGLVTKQKGPKPIRYEQIWTREPPHYDIVKENWQNNSGPVHQKLATTLDSLHRWGYKTFGIIPKRIRNLQNDLQMLHEQNGTQNLTDQIKDKEQELDNILECEETWWKQRSRELWLQHGDKNTKYFHMKANIRRNKNKIEAITDLQGQKIYEETGIEKVLVDHFKNLFTKQDTQNINETVKIVEGRINNDMHQELSKVFTREEVFQAIKDMKSLAAPGPDGLPALFYHNYWEIIGEEVTNMVLDVLNNNEDPSHLNSTYICLIPKINHPSSPSDFRPISLCNVTLKIITKTLANRIKNILPDVISPNQSAFIKGRLITDNTLIASEIFHYLAHTKRKNGFVGIKTDMAKAYDRVEWDFLEATLSTMGFPSTMVATIMKCVKTVKFSILINGHPSQEFYPQRGLRQGDPLSPYLFIICADVLSGLITKAQKEKLIHGVTICQGAPDISHLFFADDSLIFCRSNTKEVSTIQNIIQTYQKASGQLVNLAKSEMVFSKGVPNNTKQDVSNILPMQIQNQFSKYLGMPIALGRSKKQIFNFIQEKIWKKLKGWKEKHLSFAGRGTLIKAVAQAIPTYLMSSFLMPKGVCDQLEQMICNFWWGSSTDHRKIHWIKWSKVCTQKKQGGMGFRNLRAFNEALLAKQGWRLITQPNSLVTQILKAKYYPKGDFLTATHKQNMSYTWRSILQASWVIKKGSYWTIGSGQDINIWEDNWIQQKGNSTGTSSKPNNCGFTKVKELMDNNYNEWNASIINQVFNPYEAHMILQIPILDKTQPDTLTWDGTRDGTYSVKSGYHAIIDWANNSNSNNATSSNCSMEIWKVLWKLNVPPKHSHLIWRSLRNAIPVKGSLFKRGIRCDPLCPRCLDHVETIQHVFMDCEWTKKVWFASPLTLNLNLNYLTEFYDWITYMINNTDKECMEKIVAIIYEIWNARNQ
ncbi:ribonuclease H, partial [Trifolium pratense]